VAVHTPFVLRMNASPADRANPLPRNLLAAKNLHMLDAWLAHKPSFVFDYDGTLAPMFAHPAEAFMRPATRAYLQTLATHAPCAVLTGRPVQDALLFLGDLPLKMIVGNHGAEWSNGGGSKARLTDQLRARVNTWSATLPGTVVEDKAGFGMSIHYRALPARQWRLVQAFVDTLRGVKVVAGHRVVNILPKHAPTKANALPALKTFLGRKHVVFIGDDVTDEYAFQLRAKWVLSIRVGLLRTTAAAWLIRHQRDMDALLRRLSHRVTEEDETRVSKTR